MADRIPSFANGEILQNRYLVEKTLFGGMGEIIVCKDKFRRNVRIVLKTFFDDCIDSEDALSDFFQEADAWLKLGHDKNTFFLSLNDIIWLNNSPFLLMDYCPGGNLHNKIANGLLTLPDVISYATQIVIGLHYIDDLNHMIHRDIKPANILFDANGHVKISDLGIAIIKGHSITKGEDRFIGTPAYASPEQHLGEMIDIRTDIWAFGVVLYEMMMGELPFQSRQAIISGYPQKLDLLRKRAKEPLYSIILKCLRRDPGQRYMSFLELAKDWDQLISLGNDSDKHNGPHISKMSLNDETVENAWILHFFPAMSAKCWLGFDLRYLENIWRAENYYKLGQFKDALAACDESLGKTTDIQSPIALFLSGKIQNTFTFIEKPASEMGLRNYIGRYVIPPRQAVIQVLELKMKTLIWLVDEDIEGSYLQELFGLSESIILSGITDATLIIMCAECYAKAGRFQLAESLLWDLLEEYPDDIRIPGTLFITLVSQQKAGRLKKLAQFVFPTYQYKDDFPSLYMQAQLAAAIQDWKYAKVISTLALNKKPEDLQILQILCVSLLNLGNPEESLTYFQIMKKVAPKHPLTQRVAKFFPSG